MTRAIAGAVALVVIAGLSHPAQAQNRAMYEAMVKAHAKANDVPEALVHRVIVRESKYQPHLVSKGNIGMMQIKLATARGVGYTGDAEGLKDVDTNLKYAVKYLAGAYKVAGGNHDQAVRYYASGYYYAAKRQQIATGTTNIITKLKGALALAPAAMPTRQPKGKFVAPPRMDELTEASAKPADE